MDLTAHPGTVARRVDHVVRRHPPRCESMRAPYHPVLRPIGYPNVIHVEHRPPRGAALRALVMRSRLHAGGRQICCGVGPVGVGNRHDPWITSGSALLLGRRTQTRSWCRRFLVPDGGSSPGLLLMASWGGGSCRGSWCPGGTCRPVGVRRLRAAGSDRAPRGWRPHGSCWPGSIPVVRGTSGSAPRPVPRTAR